MDSTQNISTSPLASGQLVGFVTPVTESAKPDGGWESVSLVSMILTQAITNAAEARRRAAVLLIGFEPKGASMEDTPDWDRTIAALGRRIPIRAGEWAALRIGATEMAVVLGDLGDSLDALVRANAILAVLNQSRCVDGCGIAYRAAIGIGLFPEDSFAAEGLLSRASEALADMRILGLSAAGFSLRRGPCASAARTTRRLDGGGAVTRSGSRQLSGGVD